MITRLEAPLASPHGFLGRTAGASTGLYASLNVGLGSGDDPAAVRENRARAAAAITPGATLVTVRQVHSPICLVAEPWADDARPEADALATDRPGLLLGILTADCAPILLEDRAAGVVAAAHAGWKGALHGVIEATIATMEQLGAHRAIIAAAIGPCIAQRSYEVGGEFQARCEAVDDEATRFFRPGPRGQPHFDLEAYCAHRLARAGIARVTPLGRDTASDPDRFFSYRRATLAGEPDYGRQLSAIAR